MAYTPLSKRVAEAMRKNAAPPQDGSFDWNTPERTRILAQRPPVAKKNSGPRQMSMNEAMRQLRKLARKP